MTAREFLEQQAKAHGYLVEEGFHGDVVLKPDQEVSGLGLIRFCTRLSARGYQVAIASGRRLQIRAPHVKRHDWDKDRGLSCTHGMSVQQCEALYRCDSSMEELQVGIL